MRLVSFIGTMLAALQRIDKSGDPIQPLVVPVQKASMQSQRARSTRVRSSGHGRPLAHAAEGSRPEKAQPEREGRCGSEAT